MRTRVRNVSEARRDLPSLVREASAGGGPFRIGRRGEASVVLVSATEYDALRRSSRAASPAGSWESLRLELVGTPEDLDRDMRAQRQELRQALEDRLERFGKEPTAPPRRGRQSQRRK